jgi:hypothetical protein
MVIQMLFNNKIQKKIFWIKFTFKKRVIVYIIEKKLWISFQFFHIDKL